LTEGSAISMERRKYIGRVNENYIKSYSPDQGYTGYLVHGIVVLTAAIIAWMSILTRLIYQPNPVKAGLVKKVEIIHTAAVDAA